MPCTWEYSKYRRPKIWSQAVSLLRFTNLVATGPSCGYCWEAICRIPASAMDQQSPDAAPLTSKTWDSVSGSVPVATFRLYGDRTISWIVLCSHKQDPGICYGPTVPWCSSSYFKDPRFGLRQHSYSFFQFLDPQIFIQFSIISSTLSSIFDNRLQANLWYLIWTSPSSWPHVMLKTLTTSSPYQSCLRIPSTSLTTSIFDDKRSQRSQVHCEFCKGGKRERGCGTPKVIVNTCALGFKHSPRAR
jgi:hypothetical protein